MASLECSAVPWDHVDVLVERYLQDLADIVGAELVELAWQDSDEDLQIGARWPVVRGASGPTPVSRRFVPAWPLEQTGTTLLQFTRDLHGLAESPVKDRLLALRSEALVEVPLARRSPWSVIRLAFGPQWRRWDDTNVDLVVVLASTLMATLRRCVAEAHLHEQARTDPLTGLMNRAELYRQFAAVLSRRDQMARHAIPGRAGDDDQLGVLYCDLDYFKQVNDRFGHTAGDELLVRVAEVLRLHTRDGDLIARVGGDEFILVCPDLDSPETLSTIMARLCHAVSSLAPSGVPLRLSIGAAMARTGQGVDDLIRLADEAMYRAKRDGRRYGPPLVTEGATSA